MNRSSARLARLPVPLRSALLWLALPCFGCAIEPTVVHGPAPGPARPSGGASAANPALLTYCDLASTARKYAGREVRVVGAYRRAAERSEMYSLACPAAGTTWIEWSGATDCAAAAQSRSARTVAPATTTASAAAPATGGTFGLVVRGVFHRGGEGYGHLNAFDFQIDARCAEALEQVDGDAAAPDHLVPAVREAIERFERSHAPAGGS